MVPTRELAVQIDNEVKKFAAGGSYTAITHAVVYGGAKRGPQMALVRRRNFQEKEKPGLKAIFPTNFFTSK